MSTTSKASHSVGESVGCWVGAAVVGADVGVGGPEQDGVYAAIARLEVIQEFVHRVLLGDRVIEEPVVRVLCVARGR